MALVQDTVVPANNLNLVDASREGAIGSEDDRSLLRVGLVVRDPHGLVQGTLVTTTVVDKNLNSTSYIKKKRKEKRDG